MSAYSIAIAPSTYMKLGLEAISFPSREAAVTKLESACHAKSISYSVEEASSGNLVYRDNYGSTLAEIFSKIHPNLEF